MDFKKQKGSQVTYIETVNTSGLSLNSPLANLENKSAVKWVCNCVAVYDKLVCEDKETLPSLVCAITGEFSSLYQ